VESSSKPVTLILAEAEELVREGYAALCERTGRHRVVGQCSDGLAAYHLVSSQNPDIAVVNLDLTGLHTLELIDKVRRQAGKTRFIVVAARQERRTVLEVLRAGANAYLLRSGPAKQLFDALQQVMLGGIYLSPLVETDKVFTMDLAQKISDPVGLLSAREHQVFSLLVSGIRAKEIASRLELSPKTIDSHRKSLMRKLDIHDVAGLVKFAMRRNLV
jgi:DNA-binding NarL/FixJ family response regulator